MDGPLRFSLDFSCWWSLRVHVLLIPEHSLPGGFERMVTVASRARKKALSIVNVSARTIAINSQQYLKTTGEGSDSRG